MTAGIQTIIYPVKDLAAAKAAFTELLGPPTMDEVYYVGWNVAGQDVGLDPNGHAKGMTGPVPYWQISDIHSTLKSLVEAGAETVQEVKDVGAGKLIASVRDADGNPVGLIQPA